MKQKLINILLLSIAVLCACHVFYQIHTHYQNPNVTEVSQAINKRYKQLQANPTSADYVYHYNNHFNIIKWNNDEVTPPALHQEAPIYYDGTNLFLAHRKNHVLGLVALSNIPAVKNEYFNLTNPNWLNIPDHWIITQTETEDLLPNLTVPATLYLKTTGEQKLANHVLYALFIACICMVLLLKTNEQNRILIAVGVTSLLIILINTTPFNAASICSPAILAFSSLYNSLAALLLINCLIGLTSVYLTQKFVLKNSIGLQAYFHLLGFYFGYIIIQLINNSTIPFDITHPLTLNEYSLIGIISLVPIILSLNYILKQLNSATIKLVYTIGFGVILLVFGHYIGRKDLVFILWPTAVLILCYLVRHVKQQTTIIGLIFVFSVGVLCSHLFIKHSFLNHEKDQAIIAEQLISSEDPILVYLLNEFITPKLTFNTAEEAKKALSKHIANQSYFNKYKLNYNYVYDTLATSQLNFIDSKKYGKLYELSLKVTNGPNLICGFETKLIPNHLGFPELLMTGNTAFINKLNRYDFAQYNHGNMVQQYGEPAFPTTIDVLKAGTHIVQKTTATIDYLTSDGTNQVMVRSKRPSFSEKLSVFSLFTLFFLVIIVVPQWLNTTNFSAIAARLRTVIILTLVGALAAFAIGSWQFIVSQQNKKNSALLIEKANSVLTELSHKIDNYDSLTPEMNEFLTNYLVKFSNVFFTDITLFNPEGRLLASSRNELFTKQLKNTFMNPTAYQDLTNNHKSIHIQSENIGSLNYLSVYLPFRNQNNELLAYLNLPYFAKQNVLDSELSGFLTAMLNLFLLLLSATLLISLALANSLTKPLRWLQNSLIHIDLSKNKPIAYQANNEIAELIQVYNVKVKELEEKALILAETERNSAWKEMAKQVAHEIKNPLTPMKLQIQYLQLNLKKETIDESRINKTTASLIEQIDTLARIADEFAHFSTLPKSQPEPINIGELLSHVTSTFSQQDVNIQLEIPGETPSVMLDRTQVVRVLNNVIKNAQQALEQNTADKTIHISLTTDKQHIKICIADNAGGIPEHIKPSIFEPKFTTKSQGMGLGLAMCKTIITSMNGEIWFEDNTIGGTNFYISIPYQHD